MRFPVRLSGYKVMATMKRPGWWSYTIKFGVYDGALSVSGWFRYTFWHVSLQWGGRR